LIKIIHVEPNTVSIEK